MESKKYDATYKFGNTLVHVVAPSPMTEEEKNRILKEYEQAGWDIWKSLSIEEQIQINKEAARREKHEKD